jgi:uncharacterized protein (TIGR02594 family)
VQFAWVREEHIINSFGNIVNMEARELMWLELMKYYGMAEVPGPQSNPVILEWFKEMGFPNVVDDSETAWCSLVMNIVAKRCNLPYTGKLNARSWNRIGKQVIFPEIGDIAIFYRVNRTSWEGHVGLFAGLSLDKKTIWTLGGNQNNKIWIAGYPKDSADFGLLEYRSIPIAA